MGLSQELSFGELVVKQSSKDHITIWEASILEKGAFRAWVPDSRSSIGNRNKSIKIDCFIKQIDEDTSEYIGLDHNLAR